jgi:hypothetical protein
MAAAPVVLQRARAKGALSCTYFFTDSISVMTMLISPSAWLLPLWCSSVRAQKARCPVLTF